MHLKLFFLFLSVLVSTASHAVALQKHGQGSEPLNLDHTQAARQAIQAYAFDQADTFEAPETFDNYEYGAFGEEDGQQIELASTPFRYTGRWGGYSDADVSQVLNWNRWYGPDAGRWGSRDPIGIDGGFNTYVYVSNHLPSWVDPFGLRGLDMRFLIPRPNPDYEKWQRETQRNFRKGQERESDRWKALNDDTARKSKESACFDGAFWPCAAKEMLPKIDDGVSGLIDNGTYGACWTCRVFKNPVACMLCAGRIATKLLPISECAKDANQKCGCGGKK